MEYCFLILSQIPTRKVCPNATVSIRNGTVFKRAHTIRLVHVKFTLIKPLVKISTINGDNVGHIVTMKLWTIPPLIHQAGVKKLQCTPRVFSACFISKFMQKWYILTVNHFKVSLQTNSGKNYPKICLQKMMENTF